MWPVNSNAILKKAVFGFMQRIFRRGGLVSGLALIATLCAPSFLAPASAQSLPDSIADEEFWTLVTELSEPSGRFPPQLMSNEDSLLHVVPALKETVAPGGVYLGVGSEQNFTYIAAVRPRLAFIVDIRRDNMVQHLAYKALFELSADRADFIASLFSRPRPPDLDSESNVEALLDAYGSIPPDSGFHERTLGQVLDLLENGHGYPLIEADRAGIARVLDAFSQADPTTLRGFGDNTNPTFAQLMAATDLDGRQQGFLASEENFRVVQDMERKNLVVPVVGDFAGDGAIAGIGSYLKQRGATVDVFYLSNVERYLFDQGEPGMQFYSNAATLPLNESSTFIRSVTSDISARLGIPIPDGPEKWRTFLSSIDEDLTDFNEGRIRGYRDLFERR